MSGRTKQERAARRLSEAVTAFLAAADDDPDPKVAVLLSYEMERANKAYRRATAA